MKSNFENEVLLSKKTQDSEFYNISEYIFSNISIFRTFNNLDKHSLQMNPD
jgi:hypothetical protein